MDHSTLESPLVNRELEVCSCFKLEKRRLQENLLAVFQHIKGPIRNTGTDFSAGPLLTGQEAIDFFKKRGDLH